MGELKERRMAVDEIKAEIMEALADIKEAIAEAIRPPGVISASWDERPVDILASLKAVQAAARAQLQQPTVLAPPPEIVLSPLVAFSAHLNRLAWLLGLSDEERAFVEGVAAAASRPDEAYEMLMVFADWLEDRMRAAEAGGMRRLVPQTGDLLVCTYSGQRGGEAEYHARESMTQVVRLLFGLGRDVACVVVPEGVSVTYVDPKELERAGWVRKDEHGERLLRDALADQPDLYQVGTIGQQAAYLIDSLKRENAELRRHERSATLAVTAEREAYAKIAEASEPWTGEWARLIADEIRKRPPV